MNWRGCRILVTGGCSFIGSHLADALVVREPALIKVVDDLSSGELANLRAHIDQGRVEFVEGDLRDSMFAREAVRGVDLVFHLAAIHGGRGFIELHQSECAGNLALDAAVIHAAAGAGVGKLVFASSACVYPVGLQSGVHGAVLLGEEMVGPPYEPDGLYGWAKLSAELTLKALYRERGFRSASCRLFTVYGERCHESHAIIAMIARAFLGQRPFEVWGDGSQVRSWTYVSDIVSGLLLAAEHIADGSAVNLGSGEPTTVLQAAQRVLELSGHDAPIEFRPSMPTGPRNRVASHALATTSMGWRPEISFAEGLRRTIDWYFATQAREQVLRRVDSGLLSR